jgi:chondroitin AC lyase
LNGKVIVNDGIKAQNLETNDSKSIIAKWVFHDGIRYSFTKPVEICISNQLQSGSWWDINKQTDTPRESVKKEMFKLWFDHGNKPTDAFYEYIVSPGIALNELDVKDIPEIEILINSTDVQAVKHNKLNLVQAVFYNAAELQITPQLNIALKNPGIVMLNLKRNKIKSISVSDPTRKLEELAFTLNGRLNAVGNNHKIVWYAFSKQSEISVILPKAEFAGSSTTIEFK